MDEQTTPEQIGIQGHAESRGRARSSTIGYGILGVLWLITLAILWPHLVEKPPEQTVTIATLDAVELTPDAFATIQAKASALDLATPVPSPTPPSAMLLRRAHIVQPGDTLSAIALQYNSSVALLAIELTAEQFTPGNTIQVPVPNPAACPSGRLHVLEQNETLFGLSRLYDTSVEALMEANPQVGDLMRMGDVLCLPLP